MSECLCGLWVCGFGILGVCVGECPRIKIKGRLRRPGLFVMVGGGAAARDSLARTRPLEGTGDDVQELCAALWAALC